MLIIGMCVDTCAYMCSFMYMCACLCMCEYMYIYVCANVCMDMYCVHVFMSICRWVCICTCFCVSMHVCQCVYVCVYTSVYMHVHEVKHPKEMSVGASCQMWWIHELLSVLKHYLIVRILFPLRIWRFHVPLWSSDKPPGTLKPRKQAQILPPEVYRLK